MNFNKFFSIGLCSTFLLAGCSNPEREAMNNMRVHLKGKNPEFRNMDGYCGEVSYVDRSGKRSQYKHFIAEQELLIKIEDEEEPSYFKYLWSENCKGNYISPIDKAAFNKCAAVVKTYASNPSKFEYYPKESTNFSNDAGRQVVTLSFAFGDVDHKAECVISPAGGTTMTQMW